jgi:peptidase M24-like protein
VHAAAASVIAEGLVDFGLLRGESDALIESGAVTLFFPHGIGHMVGLGIRDAGEVLRGRAGTPGFPPVRVDLPLEPGHCFTVEPGIYFVPALLQDEERRGSTRTQSTGTVSTGCSTSAASGSSTCRSLAELARRWFPFSDAPRVLRRSTTSLRKLFAGWREASTARLSGPESRSPDKESDSRHEPRIVVPVVDANADLEVIARAARGARGLPTTPPARRQPRQDAVQLPP